MRKGPKAAGVAIRPHPNAAQVRNALSATNRRNFKPRSRCSLARKISMRFTQSHRHLFVSLTLALVLLSADVAIVIRGIFPEPLFRADNIRPYAEI